MLPRCILPVIFVLILTLVLPISAHVPVSAADNDAISSAVSLEKPTKSYVIYGHLHHAGNTAYYRLAMGSGDRLVVSLMTTGFGSPIPDMIIMSPEHREVTGIVPSFVTVPAGYSAEVIRGKQPVKADYEPFSPAAIFEVASYSNKTTVSGDYYIAIVSPADETQYSIATGYLEEFSLQEWVLVPISVITGHLWEGQSVIAVFAPFIGTVVFGFFLIIRRERDRARTKQPWFWFASFAGLLYLGGTSIVLVQMIRALMITGFSGAVALTLAFVIIPIILAVWLLRIARFKASRSPLDRISLGCAGLLGLLFWAGLIIGPVLAFVAAIVPDRN